MKELSRNVTMMCPVCGNTGFELVTGNYSSIEEAPDDAQLQCSDCGRRCTKKELLNENSEVIQNAIEEMKKEAIKELEKEIKKWKF